MADAGLDGVNDPLGRVDPAAFLELLLVLAQLGLVGLELPRGERLRVGAEEELEQARVPQLVELAGRLRPPAIELLLPRPCVRR